jgi:hypothetical protein
VISWPITPPIAPWLMASSSVKSKNGGCRMTAGKTIWLAVDWNYAFTVGGVIAHSDLSTGWPSFAAYRADSKRVAARMFEK